MAYIENRVQDHENRLAILGSRLIDVERAVAELERREVERSAREAKPTEKPEPDTYYLHPFPDGSRHFNRSTKDVDRFPKYRLMKDSDGRFIYTPVEENDA